MPLSVKLQNELIDFLSDDCDYTVERIQVYHLRITFITKKRLDYFPISGRATWVSSGRWFTIDDIEQFIYENYNK